VKLKAVPVKEFHGGSGFYFRLEYTGGCKLTIALSDNNSNYPTDYVVLGYFPLKYTSVFCLHFFEIENEALDLLGCIEANKSLEEIEAWFIGNMSYAFYREDLKKIIKEMIDNKEIDLEKYIEELKQCHKEISPLIEKEQEKEDEEVRRYRELEELKRGEKK